MTEEEERLQRLLRTQQDLITDLVPLLGEKNAIECAQAIFTAVIRAAKKNAGIVEN